MADAIGNSDRATAEASSYEYLKGFMNKSVLIQMEKNLTCLCQLCPLGLKQVSHIFNKFETTR